MPEFDLNSLLQLLKNLLFEIEYCLLTDTFDPASSHQKNNFVFHQFEFFDQIQ